MAAIQPAKYGCDSMDLKDNFGKAELLQKAKWMDKVITISNPGLRLWVALLLDWNIHYHM